MDFSTETAETKNSVHHNTHATPPQFIQNEHWRYQNMKKPDLQNDPYVFDLSIWDSFSAEKKDIWQPAGFIPSAQINGACQAYADGRMNVMEVKEDAKIFEHRDFPGLHVIPGLLPPETQVLFTSCLMHRDLADPKHKINLQADYDIPYPDPPLSTTMDTNTTPSTGKSPPSQIFASSFFSRERAAPKDNLIPKNNNSGDGSAIGPLKPLNTEQFLSTKLRWLTLGDQYDWPTRSYAKHTTAFPADLSTLVTGLFPSITPQSGVVLIYSAKDHMPVHRDVSEQCQRPLASFSLGCSGIFIMGKGEDEYTSATTAVSSSSPSSSSSSSEFADARHEGEEKRPRPTVAIKVNSGDCVYLDGEARWAWHAMARTMPGTCPDYLKDWPMGTPGGGKRGSGSEVGDEAKWKKWRGWMGTKRINVSCRQVWD